MKTLSAVKTSLLSLLLMAQGSTAIWAAQTNLGAFPETASWLKLQASARTAGMGGAFGAMGEDITTLGMNPAGLVQLDRPQLLLTHNVWFQDVAVEHFSAGMPLDSDSGLGLSFDYLNLGRVESYSLSGNSPVAAGILSPNGFNARVGYALALTENFDAGVAVKYVQQNLGSASGGTIGCDVGLLVHGFIPRLTLGLAAGNIGAKLQGATLPTNLKVALACKSSAIDKVHAFNLVLDGDFGLADTRAIAVGAGVEYWYNGTLALRVGDRMSDDVAGSGLTGLTFGAGVNLGAFQLNYAFMGNGDLGNSHLVSLLVKMDQSAKPKLTVKEVKILDVLKRNIQFEYNKAELTAEFTKQLDQLGDILLKRPQDRVILTGYTSQEGSPEYNRVLSERRAVAVKKVLLARGVPKSQVVSVGKGDSNPIITSGPEEQLAHNRRVEIVIIQPRPGKD